MPLPGGNDTFKNLLTYFLGLYGKQAYFASELLTPPSRKPAQNRAALVLLRLSQQR